MVPVRKLPYGPAAQNAAQGGRTDDSIRQGDTRNARGAAAFADDPRLGKEVDRICFDRTIDGFSDNQRDTVVLRSVVNSEWLVEARGCTNLRGAQSIGIDASLSCVTRGDRLIVSDNAFSLQNTTQPGPDYCLIGKMYEWNRDAAKDDQTDDDISNDQEKED